MSGYVKINFTNNGTVSVIEFFHPKGNSLTSKLLNKLEDAIYSSGNNTSVKVICIKSLGEKSFCAGASFDELLSIKTEKDGEMFFSGFAKVINAIRKVPKFVVGQVQGKTVGGGVGLACSFDYCFATTDADIKLSELAIGLGPFVIAPAVKRKIGLSAFSELSLDAKNWRSASWAKEKGIYNEIYSNINNMNKAADILLNSLSGYNHLSMSEMKKTLWQGCENWDELLVENATISGKLAMSEFTIKKLNAFKQK